LCGRDPAAKVRLSKLERKHVGLMIGKLGRQIRSLQTEPGCNVELRVCDVDGAVPYLACWPSLAGVPPHVELWTEAIFRSSAQKGLVHAMRRFGELVKEHCIRVQNRQFEFDIVRQTRITDSWADQYDAAKMRRERAQESSIRQKTRRNKLRAPKGSRARNQKRHGGRCKAGEASMRWFP